MRFALRRRPSCCNAGRVPQLFVGVWPSPKVVQVLADYPRPKDHGWSTPQQWLAQVRPLGHVTDDAIVAQLVETLRFELDGMPKPKAKLETPKHGEWLRTPVSGLEELTEVVFEVTEPIVPRTHPNNPWEVAIVLSRSRSPKELVHPLSASWTVGEVVLAKGTRSKAGHGYETVESFRLG